MFYKIAAGYVKLNYKTYKHVGMFHTNLLVNDVFEFTSVQN